MDVEHGLQSFDVSEDALTEALDVFGGELTCCPVWKSNFRRPTPSTQRCSNKLTHWLICTGVADSVTRTNRPAIKKN